MMSEWISVKDRMPPMYENVLVYDPTDRIIDTDHTKDGDTFYYFEDATYWMPLPEPPKENDAE